MRIGCGRVSTDDQTLDLQRDALKKAKCREALEEWLRTTWGTCTGRIPERDRSVFLNELTERVYAECHTDKDGTILFPVISLEVDAVKGAA